MPDDINAQRIQDEARAASELLMELQAKIDSVSDDRFIQSLHCVKLLIPMSDKRLGI